MIASLATSAEPIESPGSEAIPERNEPSAFERLVSTGREQSWLERGRSQVVFNGPPVRSDSDSDDTTH